MDADPPEGRASKGLLQPYSPVARGRSRMATARGAAAARPEDDGSSPAAARQLAGRHAPPVGARTRGKEPVGGNPALGPRIRWPL